MIRRLTALAVTVCLLASAACSPAGRGVGASPTPSTDQAALEAQRRAAGIADCPTSPARTPVPGGLPDLALDCLGGGGSVSLAGLPHGKPWVINLWAQWCGPCRAEAPHLRAAWRTHHEQVNFLGVDVNDPDPAGALAFAQSAGWPWPQVADSDFAVRQHLRVAGLPHTFLVDANGRVVHQQSGAIASEEELDRLIRTRLLGQK